VGSDDEFEQKHLFLVENGTERSHLMEPNYFFGTPGCLHDIATLFSTRFQVSGPRGGRIVLRAAIEESSSDDFNPSADIRMEGPGAEMDRLYL
jgi:hypothetical protein